MRYRRSIPAALNAAQFRQSKPATVQSQPWPRNAGGIKAAGKPQAEGHANARSRSMVMHEENETTMRTLCVALLAGSSAPHAYARGAGFMRLPRRTRSRGTSAGRCAMAESRSRSAAGCRSGACPPARRPHTARASVRAAASVAPVSSRSRRTRHVRPPAPNPTRSSGVRPRCSAIRKGQKNTSRRHVPGEATPPQGNMPQPGRCAASVCRTRVW